MGFRFRRSFKIAPGVRINVSKSGLSTSIGGRGATVNVRGDRVRETVGIPGSGLSYSQQQQRTGSSSGLAGAVVAGLILVAIAVFLFGCASNSGVAPMGADTFMVSRQAATGFSGTADLKAESLREANEYCVARGREMIVVSATESRPPYIFGNYPRAEVQFRCIEPKR